MRLAVTVIQYRIGVRDPDILPIGTDVELVHPDEVEQWAGRDEGRAVLACRKRNMEKLGKKIVLGRTPTTRCNEYPKGWHVFCFERSDFE